MRVKAAAYAEWGSEDALRELLKDSSLPLPFLFVGAGSNLLFTGDFRGTVLHSAMKGIRILPSCTFSAPSASCESEPSGHEVFDFGEKGAAGCVSDSGSEVLVEVGSGVVFDDFCAWAAEHGLWGIENLSHIPGEVGASAVQNVGAYGVEAKDVIVRVNCLELATGKSVTFDNPECGYGYRASNFKTVWKGLYAVTSVVFRLSSVPTPHLDYGHLRSAVEAAKSASSQPVSPQPVSPQPVSPQPASTQPATTAQLVSTQADKAGCHSAGDASVSSKQWDNTLTPSLIREVVTEIRRQKLPEPSELGSAGSFFKNPVIPQEHFDRILNDFRQSNGSEATVPHYVVEQPGDAAPMIKVPAAWLIEQCGWKGRQTGNVACWSKQPLVIVNLTGNATPQEVIDLENSIISSVRDRFGVTLSPEVEHI